jgi:hypothetical protein
MKDFMKKLQKVLKKSDEIEAKKKKMAKEKEVIKKAMKHPDKLGEGAKKRAHIKNPKTKVKVVMDEFKRGTLHSGSGEKVSNPKQAIAIGLSEARKAGAKIPKKKAK